HVSDVQGLSSKQLLSALQGPMTGICAAAGAAIANNTSSPSPRTFRVLLSVELLRTAASSLGDVRLHTRSVRASLKLAASGPRTAGCAARASLAGLWIASARDRLSKRARFRAGVAGVGKGFGKRHGGRSLHTS